MVKASNVTFRYELIHNSELIPMYGLIQSRNVRSAKIRGLQADLFNYPEEKIIYSDIGFKLPGFSVEKLTGYNPKRSSNEYTTQSSGLEHPFYNFLIKGCGLTQRKEFTYLY